MREQKRLVQKSVRDLEREKTAMERTEAALVADIKKAAKAGQVLVDACLFLICAFAPGLVHRPVFRLDACV